MTALPIIITMLAILFICNFDAWILRIFIIIFENRPQVFLMETFDEVLPLRCLGPSDLLLYHWHRILGQSQRLRRQLLTKLHLLWIGWTFLRWQNILIFKILFYRDWYSDHDSELHMVHWIWTGIRSHGFLDYFLCNPSNSSSQSSQGSWIGQCFYKLIIRHFILTNNKKKSIHWLYSHRKPWMGRPRSGKLWRVGLQEAICGYVFRCDGFSLLTRTINSFLFAENARPIIDRLIKHQRSSLHVDCNEVFIEYSAMLEVCFCRKFQCFLFIIN